MEFSQDEYSRALTFAALAHGDQKVPGKPYSYVVHLANVAMEVLAVLPNETGADPNLAVQCALLHDVLENTGTGAETIEAEFGGKVCAGVKALTKDKDLPREGQMADSLKRILEQPREVGMVSSLHGGGSLLGGWKASIAFQLHHPGSGRAAAERR